jgi:hypothetical protein
MEVHLTMIAALDDPDQRSSGYQRQLTQFADSLTSNGMDFSAARSLRMTEAAPVVYGGAFTVQVLPALVPVVCTLLGAWLRGRYDRRVRLKVGDIEAEAQTVEDVEKLLRRAQELQKGDQPEVIRQP